MSIQKLLGAIALATLFTGCASTQGTTTNPFLDSGDVILESTAAPSAPAVDFVQSGDVIL